MKNNGKLMIGRFRIYQKISFVTIAILVVAVISTYYLINSAKEQYHRDLSQWEARLNLTASTRAKAVENWIEDQFQTLQSIANNQGLSIYLTEKKLGNHGQDKANIDDSVDLQFIRHFLLATASRTGFYRTHAQIPANVDLSINTGIAVFDSKNNMISSTASMPHIQGELAQFVKRNNRSRYKMSNIFINKSGETSIAFISPIYAIQSERNSKNQVGIILGVKTLDDELYSLLNLPDSTTNTDETLLIKLYKGIATYISPTITGAKPLSLKLNIARKNFTINYAYKDPTKFIDADDYRSKRVLMTSRKISNAPWMMIHKIDFAEAMDASIKRRDQAILLSIATVITILAILLAVWRYGASVRSSREAERYKRLVKRFEAHELLMKLVTNNQPDPMMIIDDEGTCRFANRRAGEVAGMKAENMVHKKVHNILGAARAEKYLEVCKKLDGSTSMLSRIEKSLQVDGTYQYAQSKYVPITKIPGSGNNLPQHGILAVEQDITSSMQEKELREDLLNGLIDSLVTIIDKRDPFSAKHSDKVSDLAESLAEQLELDPADTETAAIAGRLMNLGKILLPIDLLTKQGKLTIKERKEVNKAMYATVEMLENVEFNGPVQETIKQARERWDGSGPLKMKNDDILITAQIINLANRYTAMTSPRAHRNSMDSEEVIKQMMAEIDHAYQRKVVIALVSLLDKDK